MSSSTGSPSSTSSRPRAARPPRTRRREWWIPVGLIALTLVPGIAGAVRVTELTTGGEVTEANRRFFDAPLPVIVHIIGATVFCALGAFQFMPSFRRRHPRWHRRSGRVLLVAGAVAALSGLWMTVRYDLPDTDNWLLMVERLLFGGLMAAGLVLAFAAIRRRDVVTHRRWMLRAYAVAQGAGTQALVLGPVAILVSTPGAWTKAIGMGVAWLINLAYVEWLLRRRPRPRVAAPRRGGGS